MFQDFELYEILEIQGSTIEMSKSEVNQKRPLFYFYETEKLIYDVDFRMGFDTKITKIEYEKSLLEKIIKYIKDINLKLKEILSKNLSEPFSSIATGVSLGDTNFFAKDTKQVFINSGLIHLMVLSGTNVTIIIGAIWFLLRRFSVRSRLFFALSFIWIFIFMTGFNPPAVRAGIMGSFLILGNVSGRKYNLWHSLILSLFVLTLYDVNSFFYNPSLHLSFLATFALFIMTPFFYEKISKIKINKFNFIKIFIAISISIFLTTTPYILGLSGKFGTAGILLTFICEPLTFIIMFFSFSIIFFQIILNFINYIFNFIQLNLISKFFTFILEICISFFSNITTFFANIFLEIATFGAKHFPNIELSFSQNFLIIYYTVLLSFFIFLYFKNIESDNLQ
jgi:competence protein ComEC